MSKRNETVNILFEDATDEATMELEELMGEGEAEPDLEGDQPTKLNQRAKEGTRKAKMREMYLAGQTRSQIAAALGVQYQTVFSATKDLKVEGQASRAGGGAAKMIEVEDPTTGEKKTVRRVDYIRDQYKLGRKRGDIAKELGVPYQIVFQATKNIEQHWVDNGEDQPVLVAKGSEQPEADQG